MGQRAKAARAKILKKGMAVVDRVALVDDAALGGACSVVVYVKQSGA